MTPGRAGAPSHRRLATSARAHPADVSRARDAPWDEPASPTGASGTEAVSSSSPEQPPPRERPSGPQAGIFKTELAHIGGEFYRNPEDAALALQLLIAQSAEPGKILDEYASGWKLRRAISAYGCRVVARGATGAIGSGGGARSGIGQDNHPSAGAARPVENRPPEPAGEARSQEPAATPAPGREAMLAPQTGRQDW